MSARGRLAAERTIRRARYAHTLLAAVVVLFEEIIADQEAALADEDASRAMSSAARRGTLAAIAAGAQGEDNGERTA